MPKMIVVERCQKCPYFHYIYQCEHGQTLITGCQCQITGDCYDTREAEAVPSWCPLQDAPDETKPETA
jgi:hypothetical protein